MKFEERSSNKKTKEIFSKIRDIYSNSEYPSIASMQNNLRDYNEDDVLVVVQEEINCHYLISTGVGRLDTSSFTFAQLGTNKFGRVHDLFNGIYEKVNGNKDSLDEILKIFYPESGLNIDNSIRKLKLEKLDPQDREDTINYILENIGIVYKLSVDSYSDWMIIRS